MVSSVSRTDRGIPGHVQGWLPQSAAGDADDALGAQLHSGVPCYTDFGRSVDIPMNVRQVTLLPECLDDFIDDDNPVRIIEAFVEGLEPGLLGFDGTTPSVTGRPS
jgi:hypothetical protein